MSGSSSCIALRVLFVLSAAVLIGCGSGTGAPQVSYFINVEASAGTERAVRRAFDAWEASELVAFQYAGRARAGIRRDGRNTVSFLLTWPEDVPFGHIAYTAFWYDRDGRIKEADIICNMRLANFTTYETRQPDSCFVEEVVAHETGHMLGLGHSDDPHSIMHPLIGAGAEPRPVLVDADALSALERFRAENRIGSSNRGS